MSTHHPRSRQGTRDQVEDQALECTNSSKTQRKNRKSCSRGSGLSPPKFSPLPWVSLHFPSGFSSIQSPPPPPDCPLLCLTPGWAVPSVRHAQLPWRGARIPSEEGCLSSRMCSLGWSCQAPLPIYSVVL